MSFPVAPRGRLSELIHSHCASAGVLADRVGLDAEVREALAYFFERWDGGGLPVGARGDAIPVEMRVVQLADVAEVHLRLAGVDGAAVTVMLSASPRETVYASDQVASDLEELTLTLGEGPSGVSLEESL